MPYVVQAVHLGQAALSAWGLANSFMSMRKLWDWQPTMKTASGYSDTAKYQLRKTHSTQGGGFGTILSSFLVSATLAISWQEIPGWARIVMSPSMAIMAKFMHDYMASFWEHSQRVPMATGYNDALRKTEEVLKALKWLSLSWWLTTALVGTVGY